MRKLLGLALLSAAVLGLQVALTRVLSIAQFYHFAFLVISLALLGFGASGSILAIWPRLAAPARWPWYGQLFAATALAGYAIVNRAAFDSYRIALEPAQAAVLVLDLAALALPFLFGGALVGAMLRASTDRPGRTYGASLLGSAAGAVLTPLAIEALGSAAALVLCAGAGTVAALLLADKRQARTMAAATTAGLAVVVGLAVASPSVFDLVPSPYKRISQLALDPDARVVDTRESAADRLDVVESPTIHSAPGLSLAYREPLPDQAALVLDGDTLLPVLDARDAPVELADALPVSVALAARPGGRVLMLGSGGGLDAWAALASGAREVTIVEPSALVLEALRGPLGERAGLVGDPRVRLVHDEIRSFATHDEGPYDVVELVLADDYRPISAGAFTLSETYTLTVEGMRDDLRLLGSDGLLVITRWVQEPPSESVRALAIVAEALGDRRASDHVVAFRSFQTVTILARATPFPDDDVELLLRAIDERRYDLVVAPQIPPASLNRYAVLPRLLDHELAVRLLDAPNREPVYAASLLDIAPTTDDRPFFFQFFRWEQTSAVLEGLGRRWQPFGGSGYLVVVGLLALAVGATVLLVLAPIALRRPFRAALAAAGAGTGLRAIGYATAIGLAFALVEVSLVGRLIVLVGAPTLAFATVVGGLLLWSGLGSLVSDRVPWRPSIALLAAALALAPVALGGLTAPLLGLPLALRVPVVLLLLAPPGVLMGIPLPRLVAALGGSPGLVPWVWAANGGASVVGAIAALMLALSSGFGAVLAIAGGLYLLAAALAITSPPGRTARTPPPPPAPS